MASKSKSKSKTKVKAKKSAPKKAVKKVAKKAAKKANKPVKKTAAKKIVAKKPAAKKAVTKKNTTQVQKKSQPLSAESKAAAQKFKKNFQPLYDHVLVERSGESDRTPGGLYIPVMALERPLKGKVLATGIGKLNKKGALRPLDVKEGEEVLFNKYAGTEVIIDGREYVVLKEEDILGVAK